MPDVAVFKICPLTICIVSQTNLSAVVTKRLGESYNEDTEAVASIFIGADVTSSGTAFVEDVLTSVFLQLSAKYADVDGDMANAKYQLYLEAWKHGHRDRHRIRLVREALCLRLDMLENKFLIIDDFDRCYPAVDLFLEDELSHLATRGLRVFLTSRISCLEEFPLSATCDFCQKESLNLFWGCESCDGKGVQHENTYTLCEDCVYNEEACEKWYVSCSVNLVLSSLNCVFGFLDNPDCATRTSVPSRHR